MTENAQDLRLELLKLCHTPLTADGVIERAKMYETWILEARPQKSAPHKRDTAKPKTSPPKRDTAK